MPATAIALDKGGGQLVRSCDIDRRAMVDMAKHEHPSADLTLMRNPNSSSPSPHQAVVGSSPPPPLMTTTKMASFSGDFLMTSCSGATAAATSTTTATKPLTMFYNGGVAVFHLPQDKAEDLMKMAAGEKGGGEERCPGPRRANHGEELLAKLRQAAMPISSKRSLQRFFQKRKERLYRP
ncbi:unnamed protein product [Urochloa decumbens]|uniref:Protein TIFY n=1 Tax=Urochloa decumbens TaxID=240449 RepID=A0ABC8YQ77_9POAL